MKRQIFLLAHIMFDGFYRGIYEKYSRTARRNPWETLRVNAFSL